MTTDELIARLRERAADASRRTDAVPNTLAAGGQTLDIGGLMRNMGAMADLLGQMRAAGQDAQRTSDAAARLRGMMSDLPGPAIRPLPPPADRETLDRAERVLGHRLPELLRRLYLEIADGGFGPGFGLMSIDAVARTYADLRREPPGPPEIPWPAELVPLVGEPDAYECVDTRSGAVVAYDGEALLEEWDPDEPDAVAAERGWKACFSAEAPSVEVWLERWVGSPTVAERMAAQMPTSREDLMAMHRRNMRESLARYEAMTPEERRKHISDESWERMKRAEAEGD